MSLERELGPKLSRGVKRDELMSAHTSWQVGGPADYYLCPADLDELIMIVRYAEREKMPFYVIGNGSNVLVLDGGIRGIVINIGCGFSYINASGVRVTAGAGTSMTQLAKGVAEENLTGLEFAVGIPGSLGGAVIMNAGAFGGYIGEWVESAKIVSTDGEILVMSRDELVFDYRTSNLVGKGIVVEVVLELYPGKAEDSKRKMQHFLEERRKRHPLEPSAGSVFRNLPGYPAGQLIEKAGCKGLRIGGAEVSTHHANFIINCGDAKAADIIALIKTVQERVYEKYGFELKPEIKIVGEEG